MDTQQLPVASDVAGSCSKCNNPAKKTYNCDHTDFAEYCTECYTELHYYLTEPPPDEDTDSNCERDARNP